MFITLKQSTDAMKVETDVSFHNEEDVFGMETDEFSELQECEPLVSNILR